MADFLRGKKNGDFKIGQRMTSEGLEYTIAFINKMEVENLLFPIQFSKYMSLKELAQKDYSLRLQVLDELWTGNFLLEKAEGRYLLPMDKLYDIDPDLLDLLGILPDQGLKIELSPYMMVGSKDFRINYHIFYPELGYITNYAQIMPPLIQVGEKHLFLLSEAQAELIEIINAGIPTDAEQMRYVARIQALARACNAELDPYLENENYYFPQDIELELSEENPDQIELKPFLPELPQEFAAKAEEATIETGYDQVVTPDGKRHRVIIEPPVQERLKRIKEKGRLRETDIPRFLENPLQYEDLLPEDFDLERFSERVKGLKTRVYKATPFVRAKKEGNSWFDVEVGGVMRNAVAGDDEFQLDGEEYLNLLEQARQSGQDYVKYKEQWIKVPSNSDDFIQAYERLKQERSKKGSGNKPTAFIFDIFDNVEQLEYCLDLLKEKSNLEQLKEESAKIRIKTTLHPHQEEGYKWLTHLNYAGLSGLLADDMGLGKTIQVIALMIFLQGKNLLKPSLIIAPKSILDNWQQEIFRFSEIYDVYIHQGSGRIREGFALKESAIVITTYDTLVRDQILFGEIDWKLVICDEAQRIKNHSTYTSHAVKALKAKMRLALTGTPVENRLGDLWSIMDYVQPGFLGSYKGFREEFEAPAEKVFATEEIKAIETRLSQLIKPIYLRREKEEVGTLPAKHEHEERVQLSALQLQLYRDEIFAYQEANKKSPLDTINRLIALSSHPALLTKEDLSKKSLSELYKEGPKLKAMINIVKKIKRQNEKVLIFTRLRKMQYIIKRVMMEYFRVDRCPVINGATASRQEVVDAFNNSPGFACMILSPLAAGVGLNITGANHVIHYSRWWNPAVENQATDRVYRLGQKKEVHVYCPIMVANEIDETVEQKLAQLLKEKSILSKSIIVPNKFIADQIYNELSAILK